jgi:hypothetical protein
MNGVDPQAWLANVLARIARAPGASARRTAAVELAPDRFEDGGMNFVGLDLEDHRWGTFLERVRHFPIRAGFP